MPRKPRGGVQVYLYYFFNLGAGWDGWSKPRPGRFTPWKEPVALEWEVGWATEQVWTGPEKLVSIGIRRRDRPACSKSLYRMNDPSPVSRLVVSDKL